MLRKFRAYLLSLLLIPVAGFTSADQAVELYAVDYPPYMMIDDQGNINGIDVDVTVAAFRAVGVPVTITTAPWKRVLKNIQHGRIAGALSCSKRPDRESFITYSDPVSEANQVMITNRKTTLPAKMNFTDLTPFSVVVIEGWGVQKELDREGIPHDTVPDIESGLNAVVFRDVDIFYNGELTSLYQARQSGLHKQIRTQRFQGKPSTPFHLCLSKGFPGTAELVEKFNQGLKMIHSSGEYQQIYNRYLGSKERG